MKYTRDGLRVSFAGEHTEALDAVGSGFEIWRFCLLIKPRMM